MNRRVSLRTLFVWMGVASLLLLLLGFEVRRRIAIHQAQLQLDEWRQLQRTASHLGGELSRQDGSVVLRLGSSARLSTELDQLVKEVQPEELVWRHSKHVNDEVLRGIELKSVRRLDLSGTSAGDGGLGFLAGLSLIEELDLAGTPTDDRGALEIAKRTGASLRRLVLTSTKVSDDGVAALGACLELVELKVAHTSLGDLAMKHLGNLRLESLDVSHTAVSDDSISVFQKMHALKELVYSGSGLSETRIRDDLRLHILEDGYTRPENE